MLALIRSSEHLAATVRQRALHAGVGYSHCDGAGRKLAAGILENILTEIDDLRILTEIDDLRIGCRRRRCRRASTRHGHDDITVTVS